MSPCAACRDSAGGRGLYGGAQGLHLEAPKLLHGQSDRHMVRGCAPHELRVAINEDVAGGGAQHNIVLSLEARQARSETNARVARRGCKGVGPPRFQRLRRTRSASP